MVNSVSGPAIFAKNKLQMKKLLQLTAFTFLFMACNNSGTDNNKTAKTHSDSLMDEVMEGHNAGMAKMSKMHEAQKNLNKPWIPFQNCLQLLKKTWPLIKCRLILLLTG